MQKIPVNNGMNYQPQLVIAGFLNHKHDFQGLEACLVGDFLRIQSHDLNHHLLENVLGHFSFASNEQIHAYIYIYMSIKLS